jgi:hypothetical protein
MSRIFDRLMIRCNKLVALVLAIAMFVVPAAALSSCGLLMASMSESNPCCPMMHGKPSPASIRQGPMGESCCQVSSSKPEQQSSLPTQTSNSLEVIPAAPASSVDAPYVALHSRFAELLFRPPSASPQAVLCTFLI